MLDENPQLLRQAGNVVTPGGDEIKGVTPYEFLLGAGDYELAAKVQVYFAKIENGEADRLRQCQRYEPYINEMLTQPPYDLTPLMQLIEKASSDQITTLLSQLRKDDQNDNEVCQEIRAFQQHWAPRSITKTGMHYNYNSLLHAFELLANLPVGVEEEKTILWAQLIGFQMRRLPGIDRCIMAQGLYDIVEKSKVIERSYTLTADDIGNKFPITLNDDKPFEFAQAHMMPTIFEEALHPNFDLENYGSEIYNIFKKFIMNKRCQLTELIQPVPAFRWCNML